MFGVDEQPVKAGGGAHFGGIGVSQSQPKADLGLSGSADCDFKSILHVICFHVKSQIHAPMGRNRGRSDTFCVQARGVDQL